MLTGEPNEEKGYVWVSTPDGQYIRAQAGEDLEQGDPVSIDENGVVHRVSDNPIGVALERDADGFVPVQLTNPGQYMVSFVYNDADSYADSFPWDGGSQYDMQGSFAYAPAMEAQRARAQAPAMEVQRARAQAVIRQRTTQNRYIHEDPAKLEAKKKAWALLEQYMTPEQYFAFMEGTTVELINKAESHRLLINKKGDFTILQGIKAGAGITESEGRIQSYEYPLGDQISAFLDWFRHKTNDLIAQWNCGTFGIVKEGTRR